MRAQPVWSDARLDYDRDFHRDRGLHAMLHDRQEGFLFDPMEIEYQFVVDLEEHTAVQVARQQLVLRRRPVTVSTKPFWRAKAMVLSI